MKSEILSRIAQAKVIAIVRALPREQLAPVADALLAGGIRAMEVTFDTPAAQEMIRELKKNYGDRLLVGAGTVLDTETCRTAILAGADYILSPSLNTDVIAMCNRYGKVAVPGVLTPTEIVTALSAGAEMVKVFPAGAMGPRYIKDILGPLKQVSIMAVGGVSLDNVAEFFKMGAKAAGIGSELVNLKLVENGEYSELTARAEKFLAAAK